jgi:hypothetical protein
LISEESKEDVFHRAASKYKKYPKFGPGWEREIIEDAANSFGIIGERAIARLFYLIGKGK